jgi:hypothetical protein
MKRGGPREGVPECAVVWTSETTAAKAECDHEPSSGPRAKERCHIGMAGMEVHHGMGSGAGGMNEQNKKNGENGKKGGRMKKSDDGSSVGSDVGIVVPCGNTRLMLRNLYTSLAALRDGLRSTVPVTVSYYGSREPIDEAVRERFAARFSDVSFMDLSAENGAFEYPAHQRGIDNDNTAYFGFKAKVLALYAAPYRHVLLLDSDSVPLVDPARLFASKTYVEHGNVFWPDRWCEPVPLFDELSLLAKTDARSLQSLQSLGRFGRFGRRTAGRCCSTERDTGTCSSTCCF